MGEHYQPIGGMNVADMRRSLAHCPPALVVQKKAWEEYPAELSAKCFSDCRVAEERYRLLPHGEDGCALCSSCLTRQAAGFQTR